MATLTYPQSIAISLTAGDTLSVTAGRGVATFGPGGRYGQTVSINGSATFGPYPDAVVINLCAAQTDLTYSTGSASSSSAVVAAAVAQSLKFDLPIWRKAVAKARAGVGPALLMLYGDSKTAGQGGGAGASGATQARKRSEASAVASILSRRMIKASADSWIGDQNIGAVAGYSGQPTSGAGYNLYDPTLVTAGGTAWAPDSGVSHAGGRFWIGTSGGAGTLTMTPSGTFDTVVVLYAKTGSSATSLPVTINGVAQTAINTQGANALGRTTFTGVGSGPIVFGAPTGGNAFLIGCYAYLSSDPGVVVLQAGACGQTAAWFAGGAQPWEQGVSVQNIAPALTIFKSLTNDINGSTTAASYGASIQSLITKIKSVGDLIVVIDTPGANANFTNGLYDQYISQINQICGANSVNVLDMRKVTAMTYADSNAAGYNYDTISHMTALGYAADSELLASALVSAI